LVASGVTKTPPNARFCPKNSIFMLVKDFLK
jgi:hypothetical protein